MASQLETAFQILIAFQIKHFTADFPLQREYMLRKVSPNWDFVIPLAMHCAVHATGTLIILALFSRLDLWYLALLDFVIHFTMDRIKAGPRYLGRFNDKNKSGFWNSLGFDQMVHHLTHYYIVWVMVTN